MSAELRNSFVCNARSCLGVSFMHQGRDIKGLDCIGLLVYAAKNTGFDVSADMTNYPRNPIGILPALMEQHLCRVDLPQMQWNVGDILLMRFVREPQHVAIWTGPKERTVIHSYSRIGKVVEHLLDDKWMRRIVATYRLKELV